MGALTHVKRAWLEGLTKDCWARFTDYVVGPNVAKFEVSGGHPAWEVVMHYEEAMRKRHINY